MILSKNLLNLTTNKNTNKITNTNKNTNKIECCIEFQYYIQI